MWTFTVLKCSGCWETSGNGFSQAVWPHWCCNSRGRFGLITRLTTQHFNARNNKLRTCVKTNLKLSASSCYDHLLIWEKRLSEARLRTCSREVSEAESLLDLEACDFMTSCIAAARLREFLDEGCFHNRITPFWAWWWGRLVVCQTAWSSVMYKTDETIWIVAFWVLTPCSRWLASFWTNMSPLFLAIISSNSHERHFWILWSKEETVELYIRAKITL